jgi:hypothetical protein
VTISTHELLGWLVAGYCGLRNVIRINLWINISFSLSLARADVESEANHPPFWRRAYRVEPGFRRPSRTIGPFDFAWPESRRTRRGTTQRRKRWKWSSFHTTQVGGGRLGRSVSPIRWRVTGKLSPVPMNHSPELRPACCFSRILPRIVTNYKNILHPF